MATVIAASTGWYVGFVLGIVVIAVAAAIVITIVRARAPDRRAGAHRRRAASTVVRAQTDELARDRPHQRLGRADPALGARAAEGGGGQMTSPHHDDIWTLSLVIGLVAALIVAACWSSSIQAVDDIESSVDGLLDVAGEVAGNTANIPQLQATAPVLALIVDEAVVQDGYMNALTDGYGGAA